MHDDDREKQKTKSYSSFFYLSSPSSNLLLFVPQLESYFPGGRTAAQHVDVEMSSLPKLPADPAAPAPDRPHLPYQCAATRAHTLQVKERMQQELATNYKLVADFKKSVELGEDQQRPAMAIKRERYDELQGRIARDSATLAECVRILTKKPRPATTGGSDAGPASETGGAGEVAGGSSPPTAQAESIGRSISCAIHA